MWRCARGACLCLRRTASVRPDKSLDCRFRVRYTVSMDDLYSYVLATLSPVTETRRGAEAVLESASSKPGFLAQLLQLIASAEADPVAATQAGSAVAVRQAAAIYFKNVVKRRWEDESPTDRAALRAMILPLTTVRQAAVRRQLIEAVAVIAAQDFPHNWPELLPFVSGGLERCVEQPFEHWDSALLLGSLETLEALVERYRHETRSDPLFQEILLVLQATQSLLLRLFQRLCMFWRSGSNPLETATATLVLSAMQHITEIFYSLNYQDLPEFFEDHMAEWMSEFGWILQADQALSDAPMTAGLSAPAASSAAGAAYNLDSDDEAEPAPLDTLQARIIECLILYAEKYEEEFRSLLPNFLTTICVLLVHRGLRSRYDSVVIAGIRFLTTIARGVDHLLLLHTLIEASESASGTSLLHYVCERVVAPNMQLRQADLDLFSEMPRDFIRLELDGSDVSNRRRAAGELLRALLERFEERIVHVFSGYVRSMLEACESDPRHNWRQKVNAILIVAALSWRAGTRTSGAVNTSEFIDVASFTKTHILPEITQVVSQTKRQRSPPLLTAEALKFLLMFRTRLTAADLKGLEPYLVRLLDDADPVVHSYAARFLERVLASAHQEPQMQQLKMDSSQIKPCIEAIARQMVRDPENEYLMKLLLQLAAFVPVKEGPAVAQLLVMDLEQHLGGYANALYAHNLFETLVLLLRHAGVSAIESLLFPVFERILQQDIVELAPYVFQTLGQMVLWRDEGLTPAYQRLVPPLLAPPLWDRHSYIPSMVSLLVCFLRTSPDLLCDAEHLPRVLGVFQRLVAFRAHDHDGLRLLSAIVDACASGDRLDAYLGAILQVLFLRLQNARTPKFVRHLLPFMARFIVRLGAAKILRAADALQPALLEHFLEQVWVPELAAPERSPVLCDPLIGKTICCAMIMTADARPALWVKLLDTILACCLVVEAQLGPASAPPNSRVQARHAERNLHPDDATDVEEQFILDYSVEHAELRCAQIPPLDPCPEVTHPLRLAFRSLHQHCGSSIDTVKFVTTHCRPECARLALEQMPSDTV